MKGKSLAVVNCPASGAATGALETIAAADRPVFLRRIFFCEDVGFREFIRVNGFQIRPAGKQDM